jgi:dienelactone hydrolase
LRKDAALIYLPNVIGIWQNSKLIADHFAANGYYILLLDILEGNSVPPNPPSVSKI